MLPFCCRSESVSSWNSEPR